MIKNKKFTNKIQDHILNKYINLLKFYHHFVKEKNFINNPEQVND